MFMKELILLKCSYYARQGICKAVYIFKVIPIQISVSYFTELEQIILKFV